MNLLAVPPELAPQAWIQGKEFVCAACERIGLADVQIIERDVIGGTALLWLAADGLEIIGAGVTQLFTQAGLKVCEIIAWGARDQRRCAPLLREIESYALAEGCDVVRIVGRKGWAKHLREFSVKALIMEKAL